MGQNLFAPPNVRGWPGGERWINSSTLLVRKQFLDRVGRPARLRSVPDAPRGDADAIAARPAMTGDDAVAARPAMTGGDAVRASVPVPRRAFDATAWLATQPGNDVTTRLASAERLLLALDPANADVAEARSQRDPGLFVRAVLLDPVYQLK
jgi:hypothetical protein